MTAKVTMTFKPTPRGRMLTLWEQQAGRCYWCKRRTFLPHEEGYYSKGGAPTCLARLAGTLDHMFSKIHGPRYVMACYGCNTRRSGVEHFYLNRDGKLDPRIYRPDEPIPTRKARKAMKAAEASGVPA